MILARKQDLIPAEKPYCPYGKALDLMMGREDEILMAGPAGTGKSRACLEKMHLCAQKYPGMRGLFVRKIRASCTESCLVTYEDKVVPEGHPCVKGPQRLNRQSYKYPNGSELVVGGMDKSSKTLSTEYDIIYVQEAIELVEDDWELLTRPLRNGKMPYQQIIADTNPDKPTHWLKMRCNVGKTRMIESRHEDNPLLWDQRENDWTPFGVSYITKLDALSGPRKPRLRFGKWVQAEGVVYEDWDASVHIIDPFEIPKDWVRHWSIDFGFNHAFVCQWWAKNPDGDVFLYREWYKTKWLVEDHARKIVALSVNDPKPFQVITDHDAEDRETFEKHAKVKTIAAFKDVSPGLQAVASRLKSENGRKPRIFVMRNSLVERDPALVEAKLPTCFAEEIDGYVWNLTGGRNKGEEPIKEGDHSMDACRYFVAQLDVVKRKHLWIR